MSAMTQDSKKYHVAILSFPFGSHAKTIFHLACRLASATPDITYSFLNTAKSNNSLFSASNPSLPNNMKAYIIDNGLPLNHVFSGNPLEELELFLLATPKNFQTAVDKAEQVTGRKITCLIADAFLLFPAKLAHELNVPWIPLWVPIPCALSAHLYMKLIRRIKSSYHNVVDGGGGNEDQTLEVIPGLSMMRMADLPEEVLSDETLFSQTMDQIDVLLPQATAIVMNFHEELCPHVLNNDLKSKIPNMLYVGFLTLPLPTRPLPLSDIDPYGCLSWLDGQKQKSVAYISFGNVATPPPDEFVAMVEALDNSDFPFLWSLKKNLIGELPIGFLERTRERGKIVPWAPQSQVLAHDSIGVFVTHCGCNSVYESVTCGVPMICRPFFGDHMMTARTVEDVWGVGVRIDGGAFTKTGFIRCLDLILVKEQGQVMRDRAQSLKEIVNKAAGPKGDATQDFQILIQLISS